ncbi:uncharacterized protein F21D5.5-like [Saccoglossus kowalevskii]|uniref:Uncharacterized protein F21D5.5-like n=1 Tax=Saccoglossus kowalevskii TaxID=10224 RepID=A0ABM0GZQ8_SACKO|nr:PREDICTED: uncharacterized protein F21D5.5-like [Saccoglossus kowalevskii]
MPKRKNPSTGSAPEENSVKKKKTLCKATWMWVDPAKKKTESKPVDFKAVTGALSPLIQLTGSGIPGRKNIAAFDIDGTVIKTRSGAKFAKGPKDWQWWEDKVPSKLRDAYNSGYKIVFFTNQAGIEKKHVAPKEICTKCDDIIGKLGIPVQVFMCTGQNEFRKPCAMVFDHMETQCNDGIPVNRKKSYYVGDAAGRAKNWAPGKARDFSCSDRMFAANCGLKFYTPEEYFQGGERLRKFQWRTLNPTKELKNAASRVPETYHTKKQEMIVMVGYPASGKSTFSRNYLVPHDYEIVNMDTLGTQSKCKKLTNQVLEAGKSVVIDNTNPHKYIRKDYMDLAKAYGVPARCFWFQTSLELAHHMNLYRQTQTRGKTRRVPDVAFNVFKMNFSEPELAEGFSEIKKIEFIPKFASKNDESVFKQWTC